MPLSEEELRLLEQMERALVADDPKLASTLRGTALRRRARRQVIGAAAVFTLGMAILLMGGVVARVVLLGVLGFVIMLGSAYVGLNAWRGHPAPVPFAASAEGEAHAAGLSVVQGGKKTRSPRATRAPRMRPARPHTTMMERFEERWRRRRDRDQGF